jgi:putative hydrolase of the HAD superfamily
LNFIKHGNFILEIFYNKTDRGFLMIRLIAFDLDDTLYNATWLVNKSRLGGIQLMVEKGLKIKDIDKAVTVLNKVVKDYGSNHSKHYDIFLQLIQKRPDIVENSNFNIPKYVATGIIGYHKIKVRYLKAYRDVKSFLERMKELKFKLAIFSDGIAVKQYEKLLRMNIVNFFDYIFISDEIGFTKPDPRFFNHCINELKLLPSEIIYIGDRLDKDILPANNIGINTVLIHRGGKYDPNIHKIEKVTQPDFEIHSLKELFKIIENINKSHLSNA